MANADYLMVSMHRYNSRTQGTGGSANLTTTQCTSWRSFDGSGNYTDRTIAGLMVFGDV